MSFQGLFKRFAGSETPEAPETANGSQKTTTNPSSFFSTPSKLLDSVQSKKDGIMSDLSTKLSNIKLPGGGATDKSPSQEGEDDASSASEYGDNGDQPLYAEDAPEARRGSLASVDSLPDEEAVSYRNFISDIVLRLFDDRQTLSTIDRGTFTRYCAHHTGRSWFAKEALNQRTKQKMVSETVMRRLTEYFAIVLRECNATDDFSPARVLMQLCFTFYVDKTENGNPRQDYLHQRLKDQPIWQSMRFWNASFFDTLQQERAKIPFWNRIEDEASSHSEKEFQQDVAFAILSQFVWNMASLGLPKDACSEFLRKQATAASLQRERVRILKGNLDRLIA